MGFVEKRNGRYRARYRDPLGRQRSETFTRKADADRYLREMVVDVERGRWIDPAGADMPLARWAEEFLSLARRLSPSTRETYARDLDRYILPRFGTYRIGRLPADEIEQWLLDEIAGGLAPSSVHRHYRTLRRVLQVAVEKERVLRNPCDRVQPPRVPKREMAFLTWEQGVDLGEAINDRYRALMSRLQPDRTVAGPNCSSWRRSLEAIVPDPTMPIFSAGGCCRWSDQTSSGTRSNARPSLHPTVAVGALR